MGIRLHARTLFGLFALLLTSRPTNAQNGAACPQSLDFLENSMGQNPCEVTSWLFSQCSRISPYTLPALQDRQTGYAGPTNTSRIWWQFNACLCSMPVYNLIEACQVCQNRNIGTWAVWTASCNSSFTGSTGTPTLFFPQPVPNGTVIPPWALIDNRAQPWSEQQAQQNVTGGTGGGNGTSGGNSTSPGSDSFSSSSSNTGAIAGGVVGGVGGAIVLAVGAWFLARRYRRRPAHTDEMAFIGQGGTNAGRITPFWTMSNWRGRTPAPGTGASPLPSGSSPSNAGAHDSYSGSPGYPYMATNAGYGSPPSTGGGNRPVPELMTPAPAASPSSESASPPGGERSSGSQQRNDGMHDLEQPDSYPAFPGPGRT